MTLAEADIKTRHTSWKDWTARGGRRHSRLDDEGWLFDEEDHNPGRRHLL